MDSLACRSPAMCIWVRRCLHRTRRPLALNFKVLLEAFAGSYLSSGSPCRARVTVTKGAAIYRRGRLRLNCRAWKSKCFVAYV
jgi:hypothetical protein